MSKEPDPLGRRSPSGHFMPRGGRKPEKRSDQVLVRGQSAAAAGASEAASFFARLITDPEIRDVSFDLFMFGHYNLAVAEAYKAVDRFVAERTPSLMHNGTTLMEQVFAPAAPYLRWSKMETRSQIDEQKGNHRLYSGAMLGIRNPTTHEFGWVDEHDLALELIVFAQHLLRKARLAELASGKAKTSTA